MRRLSYLALVAAVLAFAATFGATGVNAAVRHKPLPQDPCDLVNVNKVEAALGVPVGAATPQVQPGAAGCFVPIPYDRATCTVQPDPGVFVIAGKPTGSDQTTLKEAATLAEQQDFEVRRLKGKAFGRKGAFLASGGSVWTFYGGKGKYAIQVETSAPCGAVPLETLATVAEMVAKGVVRQL